METIENILADMDGGATEPVATVEHVVAPAHPGQAPFPAPGVYFGMDDDTYHSIHACSASGLKNMAVSSMDYWAMSKLNQEREEEKAKDDGKLTPMELGKAYHAYICEGVVEFEKRYAVALDKDTCRMNAEGAGKSLCVTIADLRLAIDVAGGKPKGTGKDALIEQLLDHDPDAHVWDRMVAKHCEQHQGKVMISPMLFRRIAIAQAMIAGDPQLKDAFKGGHSEVSIFWYDEETGVPMKARLDYLKMNHLIDLKSFSNKQRKPIQRAIDGAIAYEKYFIAVVVYLEAIAAAKKMVRESKGKGTAWGYIPFRKTSDTPPVMEAAPLTGPPLGWLWDWAHQPEPEVLFVFQQTGIAPVTRGRIMPKAGTYMITQTAVKMLRRKWKRCAATYGVDPWLDIEPIVATVDEELNQWAATDFGDIEYEGGATT